MNGISSRFQNGVAAWAYGEATAGQSGVSVTAAAYRVLRRYHALRFQIRMPEQNLDGRQVRHHFPAAESRNYAATCEGQRVSSNRHGERLRHRHTRSRGPTWAAQLRDARSYWETSRPSASSSASTRVASPATWCTMAGRDPCRPCPYGCVRSSVRYRYPAHEVGPVRCAARRSSRAS